MASPELEQANEIMAQLAQATMGAGEGDFIAGLRHAMDTVIPFEVTEAATVTAGERQRRARRVVDGR